MPSHEVTPRGDRIVPVSPSSNIEVTKDEELKKGARVYAQVPQNDDGEELPQTGNRLRGRCIHLSFLVGLVVLFASFSITIGVLYHFSRAKGGLTTEHESRRYLWIYGPTAIIVLLRVFWRVIDLKVKQSTPWHELANGPAPADKTVLLEYFSRTIFGNIWRSMRNSHWPVTMTIMGHLILLLMVVFATGLFALEATLVTEQSVQFTRNHFNGSAYNATQDDTSPALLNFAIRTQNLSYPRGTTESTLFPLFEPVGVFPEDATYQANVSGLEVNMDCETLDIKNGSIEKAFLPWFSLGAPYFLVNISTPTCQIKNVRVGSGPTGMVHTDNQTQSYGATMRLHVCNTDYDDSKPHHMGGPNEAAYNKTFDRTLDSRILFTVVNYGMPPTETSEKPGIWINSLTALLCKPSYTINNYRVEYAQNSTITKHSLLEKTDASLPDFHPGDISRAVDNMFGNYAELYLGMGGVDFTLSDAVPPFYQMIETEIGGPKSNISLKDLIDPEMLKPYAEVLLKSSAVQMLHANIMTGMSNPASDVLEGTATFFRERLHVKVISTGFLCAGFATMSILCVVLLFILPGKPHVKTPIGSTLVVADALRSSPRTLRTDFSSGASNVDTQLKSWDFVSHQTRGGDGVAIVRAAPSNGRPIVVADEATPDSQTRADTVQRWWRPASSRTWFTATVVAFALIIIGILEGIQHISDQNQGFVGVKSMDLGTTVLAQYIPAAVALAITLMIGSIELTISAVTPYATLMKGNAPASRTLSADYLTKSGPHIFVLSFLNRHLALSVILVTTFVASFLSIVIPGLYSHITLPTTMDTTVFQLDKFDPSGSDISFEDHGAATMMNLLTYYNVEYPQWAFDDLAIPEFGGLSANSEPRDTSSKSSATVSLRTEATRARLRCEPALEDTKWEAERQTMYKPSGIFNMVTVAAKSHLLWSMCSNPPKTLLNTTSTVGAVTFDREFFTDNSTKPGSKIHIGRGSILNWDTTRGGKYDGVDVVGGDLIKYRQGEGLDPQNITLADWGCPSLLFTLGTLALSKDETRVVLNTTTNGRDKDVIHTLDVEADVTNIVCWQNLESVETNVTLEYPDLAVSAEHPPQPDDSAVRWVQNLTATRDGTTFQFAPNNLLISLSNPNGSLSDPFTPADDVDRFIQAIAHIASKEHNLTLPDLSNATTLQHMVQKLYGRYMAQALSSNMRVDFDEPTPAMNLTDTLWTPSSALYNLTSRLAARSTPSYATTTTTKLLRRRADSASRAVPAVLTQADEGAHTRMVQNAAPKIALQAMLGFLAAGVILARVLLRTKEVLPHEPYSIAGRAVLVADGNVLELSESEAQGRGSETLYRLGWWKDQGGVERYGICVQGRE